MQFPIRTVTRMPIVTPVTNPSAHSAPLFKNELVEKVAPCLTIRFTQLYPGREWRHVWHVNISREGERTTPCLLGWRHGTTQLDRRRDDLLCHRPWCESAIHGSDPHTAPRTWIYDDHAGQKADEELRRLFGDARTPAGGGQDRRERGVDWREEKDGHEPLEAMAVRVELILELGG